MYGLWIRPEIHHRTCEGAEKDHWSGGLQYYDGLVRILALDPGRYGKDCQRDDQRKYGPSGILCRSLALWQYHGHGSENADQGRFPVFHPHHWRNPVFLWLYGLTGRIPGILG